MHRQADRQACALFTIRYRPVWQDRISTDVVTKWAHMATIMWTSSCRNISTYTYLKKASDVIRSLKGMAVRVVRTCWCLKQKEHSGTSVPLKYILNNACATFVCTRERAQMAGRAVHGWHIYAAWHVVAFAMCEAIIVVNCNAFFT